MEHLENEEDIEAIRICLERHPREVNSEYREFANKMVVGLDSAVSEETECLLGVDFDDVNRKVFCDCARAISIHIDRSYSQSARLLGHQIYLRTSVEGTIILEHGFAQELAEARGKVVLAFMEDEEGKTWITDQANTVTLADMKKRGYCAQCVGSGKVDDGSVCGYCGGDGNYESFMASALHDL